MTITIDQLKSLTSGVGIPYFIDPDRPALLLAINGLTGSYQVIAKIEVDGRFLQLRTKPNTYATCRADHAHIDAVLRVLLALDYSRRLVKFAWDVMDGEIVAYADLWLEDATLTQEQFKAMLSVYIPIMDLGHERIVKTIETGVDPAEGGDDDMMQRMRDLLARLPHDTPPGGGEPTPQ
jgi:hypothetical protein